MIDIPKLIKMAELSIRIFTKRLLEDVAYYKQLPQKGCDELRMALHLRMSVLLSLIEMSTIEKAMLGTKHAYVKRYHYKNLVANALECYKMLYHFKDCRKKSIWTRVGRLVQEINDGELKTQYDQITESLNEFGDKSVNKDLRDVTMHYAEYLITVYQMTVELNNENDALTYFAEFVEILNKMLSFSTSLVSIYQNQDPRIEEPCPVRTSLIGDQVLLAYMQKLDSKHTMVYSIQNVIPKGSEELDQMAHKEKKIGQLKDYLEQHSQLYVTDSFTTIINLYEMQVLLRFMMLDLASNIEAFGNSTSTMEAAMNARRFVIPQVSMLALLCGYSEEEREKSLWHSIEGLVPDTMIEQKDAIVRSMTDLTTLIPKKKRHAHVHVYDDKGKNQVPNFVDALEDLNFIEEFLSVKKISEFYAQFIRFLVELTTYLAEKEHQQAEENTRKFHEKLDRIVSIFERSNAAEETIQKLKEQIAKIKEIPSNFGI